MFKQRVITAVLLALGFLALLFGLAPRGFSMAIAPVVLAAGWEWTNLVGIKQTLNRALYLILLLAVLTMSGLAIGLAGTIDVAAGQYIMMLGSAMWAIIFLWVQGYPSSAILWSSRPVLALLGILLLTITWLAIVIIVHQIHGAWLLFFAVVIVAFADIGGYIAGNLFGKTKLAPLVSPGKTWEGFFGGMLMQCILIAVMAYLMPPRVGLSDLVILVLPVALYSVLGDLFESMVKRQSGVKDSGALLPGHGGVLDRIDGLMAALPLFCLIFLLLDLF